MGYETTYFLVVDNKVMYYSRDYDSVFERIADVYGDRLCIDYYGCMGRESILKHEYMEHHEGCDFFIADTHLLDWGTYEETPIYIQVINIHYLMEYADTDSGLAIIEWLKFNKDKYTLDYSKSDFKKYCVMVEDSFEGSFDSLEEAYDYLKNHDIYGNLEVAELGIKLCETGLGCLLHDNGYSIIGSNVINKEGMDFDIAIIELDKVFNHFHKSNAESLAYVLDRDRSRYTLSIIDDNERLLKACEMLARMSECKDCYEFMEKGCPFSDGDGCSGECQRVEDWVKYFKDIK